MIRPSIFYANFTQVHLIGLPGYYNMKQYNEEVCEKIGEKCKWICSTYWN